MSSKGTYVCALRHKYLNAGLVRLRDETTASVLADGSSAHHALGFKQTDVNALQWFPKLRYLSRSGPTSPLVGSQIEI